MLLQRHVALLARMRGGQGKEEKEDVGQYRNDYKSGSGRLKGDQKKKLEHKLDCEKCENNRTLTCVAHIWHTIGATMCQSGHMFPDKSNRRLALMETLQIEEPTEAAEVGQLVAAGSRRAILAT